MANFEVLEKLIRCAISGKVPTEFENKEVDVDAALRDELAKFMGNHYQFMENRYRIFELMAKAVDENYANNVDLKALASFCDFEQYRDGVKPTYYVPVNLARSKAFVTRVTPSGTYEAFRPDSNTFDIDTVAYGAAAYVDFDRVLLGADSIRPLIDVISAGLIDRTFQLINELLISSWKAIGRPANTKKTHAGFDVQSMRDLCMAIAPYGRPSIFCAPEFAATITNLSTIAGQNPNVGAQDLADIRDRGYIGMFYGCPVNVLPQSYLDEMNKKLLLDPSVAFVIPTGKNKIAKVAYQGATRIDDFKNKGDRSLEVQVNKKMGAAIVTRPNSWGIYQNTTLASSYNVPILV